MRYQVEGADLCIRIPIEALAAEAASMFCIARVVDANALAMSVGRELCECEDMGEEYYLSRALDAALERVVESADKSLQYADNIE